MTLPSPTGPAGPDSDGVSGDAGAEADAEAEAEAEADAGGEGGFGEGEGTTVAVAVGSALGDSGGAGGIAHEAVASITSPHPAAATAAARLPRLI
ncbi:hypothetical protein AB0N09_41285 [Streptomyces erythrochromogenes]|uniref:hypothetical protein n=1 Tax=Streptomyces erythrochromogenes TaxID=285574 RepID=UPI0034474F7D